MLVLDRKIREGFWIGDEIYVKVLSVGKRRVKLGIDAPGGLSVVRGELRPERQARTPSQNNAQRLASHRRDPSG